MAGRHGRGNAHVAKGWHVHLIASPMKKLKQNKEVAIYNAHKRQKVAKRVTTLEVAQQAKIKYSSGTKNRFAS